jgi:hypothetical protein
MRETVRELGEQRATGFLKKFYGWYLGRGRFPRPFKQELVQLATTRRGRARLLAAAPGARFVLERLEAELPDPRRRGPARRCRSRSTAAAWSFTCLKLSRSVEHDRQRRAEPAGALDLRVECLDEASSVHETGEVVGDRLTLDDVVQAGILERDGGLRGEPLGERARVLAEAAVRREQQEACRRIELERQRFP